ncbi:phospholipase D family protein [Caenispirillum bisanense]|uniref:PLD-like domain-containing protein n=1 Tax=Caenispirillum bisanense TaxID=414052 RepID=A0A286GQ67_9PROT|nr:phospholipase D family protein [Caenispirillum bisanense]SOD97229.1 PLD-like domain-containing protein [Caenispirillum bisanense]
MTYSILNAFDLMARLKQEIAKGGTVDLAVAFWGAGAGQELGLDGGRKARIVCNLDMGGTNPHEIRALKDLGCDVRAHSRLHAKLGVVGDSFSFLGSSNMSANGLGFEGEDTAGWEEANVAFPTVDASVEQRFHDLWTAADTITEERLKQAEEAWLLRQRTNRTILPPDAKRRTFLETLKEDPLFFEAFNVHVVVYDELDPEDQAVADQGHAKAQRLYGSEFWVYWDWTDLPRDAILVDFRKPRRGYLAFDGIYRRDPTFKDFNESGESFQPAYKINDIEGLEVGQDRDALRVAVKRYISDHAQDESYCFPINALRDYL